MKPNEPKTSAAAACPASARNARKGESKTTEEGGKEQDEREWRVQKKKTWDKIHVDHSNSPSSFFHV